MGRDSHSRPAGGNGLSGVSSPEFSAGNPFLQHADLPELGDGRVGHESCPRLRDECARDRAESGESAGRVSTDTVGLDGGGRALPP